jgi:Uma2 family endonuclease
VELLETPHLLTVEEYMSLAIDGRTELIEGIIYDVMPRNAAHRNALNVLGRILTRALDERYAIQQQDAVAITGWKGRNAPEPDLAVIAQGYIDPIPTAKETFAVIEVSDTTYKRDRRKAGLYVAAGIPAYIVNIPERRVEVYESATDLQQLHGRVVPYGESFIVLGVKIAVADLFKPE